MIGVLLDQGRLARRTRAFLGWAVLLIMVFVVHIWAYTYQTCDPLPYILLIGIIADAGFYQEIYQGIYCSRKPRLCEDGLQGRGLSC